MQQKEQKIIALKNSSNFFDKLIKAKNVDGLYRLAGILLNPDTVLKKSGKGIHILRILENEGQISACVDSRKAGCLSLKWFIKSEDDERKEFLTNVLNSLDTYNLIGNILNAPLYGFQPLEIIWKKQDGYIVPDEITAPPQEWFHFNTENELCFKMKGVKDGFVINFSEKKFLCPVHKATFENPYGQAVLSRCFWDNIFKKGGYEFWARFMEKCSMPHYIGTYARGESTDKIEEFAQSIHDMIQDAVITIPEGAKIEIVEPSGKAASFEIYKEFIKICDDNIAKNIIGQTLTTDTGDTGSYALGKVHYAVREDIINSDKRLVEKTLNELLGFIEELNYGNRTAAFEFIEKTGIKLELTERDTKLKGLGVKFSKKYIKNAYNLEDDDFEIVQTENLNSMDFSESVSRGEVNAQKELDEFIEYLNNNETDKPLNNAVTPVIEYLSNTNDTEGALEKLAEIYPLADFSELEETLARVMFVSELWGRINARR